VISSLGLSGCAGGIGPSAFNGSLNGTIVNSIPAAQNGSVLPPQPPSREQPPRPATQPGAETRSIGHRATVWAIQQLGLKPATKIVLRFLSDRHNPDCGCFPAQAQLVEDAEVAIYALNEHRARLEELRPIPASWFMIPGSTSGRPHATSWGSRMAFHKSHLWNSETWKRV